MPNDITLPEPVGARGREWAVAVVLGHGSHWSLAVEGSDRWESRESADRRAKNAAPIKHHCGTPGRRSPDQGGSGIPAGVPRHLRSRLGFRDGRLGIHRRQGRRLMEGTDISQVVVA